MSSHGESQIIYVATLFSGKWSITLYSLRLGYASWSPSKKYSMYKEETSLLCKYLINTSSGHVNSYVHLIWCDESDILYLWCAFSNPKTPVWWKIYVLALLNYGIPR